MLADVVAVDGAALPVPQFLALCARSYRSGAQEVLVSSRDVFVAAGLAALREPPADWIQLGVTVGRSRYPALCQDVAVVARKLRAEGVASGFFHMCKPPGLRLRFARGPADTGELATELADVVRRWRADGLVVDCLPGCYEPESVLFGGVASMEHVHDLFEIDSLAWLDRHACSGGRAPWAVSLLMVRAVLDGLDITGFEDLGVWTELRDRWHRRLPAELLDAPAFTRVAPLVQEAWRCLDLLAIELDPVDQDVVESFRRAALPIVQRWRREYFDTAAARRGPRRTVAGVVAFHWNRAGLSIEWQSVLTEALLSYVDGPA